MSNSLERIIQRRNAAWKPPSGEPMSEWAEKYGYLSPESSAVIGRFHPLPYQREIMDAFSDPRVNTLTLMKSARVGGTKIINFGLAYTIVQKPRPILVVQPSLKAAKRYSKIELNPMFRDMPILHDKVAKTRSRDSSNTLLQKDFVGGTIYIYGANSPADLSAITVGTVCLDEEDRYGVEAGAEGDPSDLAIKRAETHPDQLIVHNSSPGDKLNSKIERSFLEGDQRFYHVPCPHCGSMRPLIFRAVSGEEPGHAMEWPEGEPKKAFFRCADCRREIGEQDKIRMLDKGAWIARKPFDGHASFFIWSAYSYAPNATWGHIATTFLKSQESPAKLKVFVNTWLGQTWTSQGEVPDWHRLYERREDYPRGVVPARARAITAAADVHPDRIEVGIIAWGPGLENWGIDYRVIQGPTDSISSPVWRQLDELLLEQFPSESGRMFTIAKFGIDCGFNTQVVTAWVRRQAFPRVIALKGSDSERQIIGAPAFTETTLGGKRIKGSVKHYPVGVSLIKSEIYGWLKLPAPTNENPAIPIGYSHFSVNIHNEEHFRQLTAERLEVTETKSGRRKYEWVKDYKRNEFLDIQVYNRALAFQIGVDRWKISDTPPPAPAKGKMVTPQLPAPPPPSPRIPQRKPALRSLRPRRLW